MLKSSLCDYSDASILVIGIIILVEEGADAATITADRNNKHVIFKNCTLLTDCITVINNTQVDNAKDLDIIMSMYNLTEYSDNYSKTSGNLWPYCKDVSNDPIEESESFKFKSIFYNAGIINAEIALLLKYLSKFKRALNTLNKL